MSKEFNLKYKKSFYISIIIHVVLLSLLLLSFSWHYEPPIVNKGEKVVHAVAVDNTQVDKIVKKLKDQQAEKRAAEKERQKHLDELANKATKQRESEQKKLADLKRQQVQAAKKLKSEQQQAQKDLAKLKSQQQTQQKQLSSLQNQQKAAQNKLAELKKADAAKEAQEQQYKAALALQKQIADKQAAIAQQRSQAIEGVVNKYKGLIVEAISQNWLVPPGTNPNTTCQLYIELVAGGKVSSVKVTKSSGNSLLDRSAVAAVYKASPLPVPDDAQAFADFKQFSLTVKPENYIQE